ncbi:MAG: hypothetical protein A2Y76_12290 [Planctomycetes bacterium RBG_13_60_9]|nr:MAG: hypothetical protein A2Y76_12290 [Planctomycetes bacterium RBG_13_60_9]
MTVEDTYHLTDDKVDILSHRNRRDQIHVLTIDPILGTDVCERLRADDRFRHCTVIRPDATTVGEALEQLEQMAKETITSRLLIFDVRRVTLPRLRKPFNAIVGYNRRDFNKLCYSICIGDGPPTLFQNGYSLTAFIPYLSAHRVDHYPAVFFYDPFLHYEPNELETRGIDEDFIIPDEIPRRLAGYLQKVSDRKLGRIRRFFRATDEEEEVRKKRRRMLKRLYRRQLSAQFPDYPQEIKSLFSRRGLRLATEKLNLYPLFFEDWVYRLIHKAGQNASRGAGQSGQ